MPISPEPISPAKTIDVKCARTHNLRDISLRLPRDRFIIITGLSGSGKSSFAFDTLHAEGQRKYIESLSASARQFLGQLPKADVEEITGLPPTVAISQFAGRSNPRSTVATSTEIHDYLRLLFARLGAPHCPRCGKPIERRTATQIVDAVLAMSPGSRILILAPLARGESPHLDTLLPSIAQQGFVRARLNGEVIETKSPPPLPPNASCNVEAVVDRLVLKNEIRGRLADSIEIALRLADGIVIVSQQGSGDGDSAWTDHTFAQRSACIACNLPLPDLEPRLFSFNSPVGACPGCDGLGIATEFDPDRVIPDPSLPLNQGAVAAWRHAGPIAARHYAAMLQFFCTQFNISPSTPFRLLPAKTQSAFLHGGAAKPPGKSAAPAGNASHAEDMFVGVLPELTHRWKQTKSAVLKDRLAAYLTEQPCPSCRGARLRPESLAVRIGDKNIDDIARLDLASALRVVESLPIDPARAPIADPILKEIARRLRFMIDIGVGYLTLARRTNTLSGGEAQRIRLSTQLGTGLVGVCYVLDEPTIGLHARDNARLIESLRRLVSTGNTVIVVEHDPELIEAADWIVDIGPGAGRDGGRLLANGDYAALLASPESITARYLRGDLRIPIPEKRRTISKSRAIEITGASENNLKSIDVALPLGVFCCLTGVSGSGKSTLAHQILLPAARRRLLDAPGRIGAHRALSGLAAIERIIEINQSPLGRSPRANAATFTGLFDQVRDLFAKTREARLRGYDAGRFSFNVKGGRCEACQGQGLQRVEMHFLPDVFIQCPECRGTRYNRETLEIKYRGQSIADILALSVDDACTFFENLSGLRQWLIALRDVGLGYMALGQPANTLSGGEAQRIKLAAELGKSAPGHTLYLLDEPTTGLHFADIHRLVDVLNRLCDLGHSLLVIEHNLDIIKQADWIIDLGPEGGDAGGRIVAEGTPEQIAAHPDSHTGRALRRALGLP